MLDTKQEIFHTDYRRPPLYPKQFAAIYDEHRYALIEASTKAGKTSGCISWLVEQACGKPNSTHWWIAPVTAQAEIAFRRMMRALPEGFVTPVLSPTKKLLFPNGSSVWFKSGDKSDSLYGDDVDSAVIDEASRFKEDSWFAVRSTLTKTNGRIRIIGNVKGRRNWFYQLARRAEQGDDDMGYHKLTAFDAVEAGVISPQEIEDARRILPEHVFRELYEAVPSDDEGNPFGIKAIDDCILPQSSGEPVCWGWDLARVMDYTVGIALDKIGRVCRFERNRGRKWSEQTAHIRDLVGKRVPALIDSTGVGDPIVEELQAYSEKIQGYKFTSPSKQQLMEGLALHVHAGDIAFPEGPIALEMRAFEYRHTATGIRYSAPEGLHDDCVCALALAVMCRSERFRKSTYDTSMNWVG